MKLADDLKDMGCCGKFPANRAILMDMTLIVVRPVFIIFILPDFSKTGLTTISVIQIIVKCGRSEINRTKEMSENVVQPGIEPGSPDFHSRFSLISLVVFISDLPHLTVNRDSSVWYGIT